MDSTNKYIINTTMDSTNATFNGTSSEVMEKVQSVSLAIIVVMGIFCNSLSLWVFLTPALRSRSPGLYLAALAMADNCVLVGEAFIWLRNHSDIQSLLANAPMCRFNYYLRYSGRLWSAMLTTTITIERYLFIAHPLRSARFLSTVAARLTIFLSFLASFTLSSYALYMLDRNNKMSHCRIVPSMEANFKIWDLLISRILADAIPGVTVAVVTVMILHALFKIRKERKTMLPDLITEGRRHVSNRDIYMTLILILIAVSFLVLKLPYTILWYVRDYKRKISADRHSTPLLDNIVDVAYILAVLSYAINLFLYSIGGTIFRETLRKRFQRLRLLSRSVISSTKTRSSLVVEPHRQSQALV